MSRGARQPAPVAARAVAAPRDERRRALWIAAGLVAAVLLLYGQTGRFEFVQLDDYTFIVDNPPVRAGLSADGLAWSLTAQYPNWHPLTWWTHMLDVELFGLTAGGPHLVSAVWHATNTVLLFLALRLLTGALWPSALAAALFAVHPLRAESVAWLSERKDLTSGCFWMVTLLAYAWYVRRPSLPRYLAVAAALALGLMGKTMVVTLPVILLLLDYWPLGRLRVWNGDGRPRGAAPTVGGAGVLRWFDGLHVLHEKLPLLALSLLASALTVQTQQTVSGVRSLSEIPLTWRIAVALEAPFVYLRKLVWPTDLAAIYPHPALLAGASLGRAATPALTSAFALLAVTVACLALARRRPYLIVGWLWYLIALVPVIGLVQIGVQALADRYTYLSMPGIYIMLAWSLRDLVAARPHLRRPVAAAAAVGLVILAALSWRQIGTWHDSVTLFEHALAVTDDNYVAHASLGAVLRAQGRADEALQHLDTALRLRPDEPFTHMHRGAVLQDRGRLDEAATEHATALQLNPGYADAYGNLGVVRLRQGRLSDAETALRMAIRLDPGAALAYANLGAVLLQQQRWTDTADTLATAIALDPDAPEPHNNLAVALIRQGDWSQAAVELETALRLRPDYVNAQRNLEIVRSKLGEPNSRLSD